MEKDGREKKGVAFGFSYSIKDRYGCQLIKTANVVHSSEPGNNKHGHKINMAEIAMVIVIDGERWKRKKRGGLWVQLFYKGSIWLSADKNS